MSARVTEAHLWKAADIATRLPLSKTPEDGCRREEIIAQALADAEQAEREACAEIAEDDFRLEGGWEGPVAKAIRARGTPAKETTDD